MHSIETICDCFYLNYSFFSTSKSSITLNPTRQDSDGMPPSPFDAQVSRNFSRIFSSVNSKDVYNTYLDNYYR